MLAPSIPTTKLASIFGLKRRGGSYSHFCSRLRRYFVRKDIEVQWLKTESRKSSGGRPLRFAELTFEHIESWLGYVAPNYIDEFRQVLSNFKGFAEFPERVERAFNEGIKAKRDAAKALRDQRGIAAPPKQKPSTEPQTLPGQPPKPPTPPVRRQISVPSDFYVPYKAPYELHRSDATIASIEEYCINADEEMPKLNGKPIATDEELKEFQRVMRYETYFRELDYLAGHAHEGDEQKLKFLKKFEMYSQRGYDPCRRFDERFTHQDIVNNEEVKKYFFAIMLQGNDCRRTDWVQSNWDFACSLGLEETVLGWEAQYGVRLF